jgi:hypothetical protein
MSMVSDHRSLVGYVVGVSEVVGGDGWLLVGVEAGVVSGSSDICWSSLLQRNGGDGGACGGREELVGQGVSYVGVDLSMDWPVAVS